MSDLADDEATAKRARDVIDRLVAVFDRISGAESVPFREPTQDLIPVVFGWWARINRTSEAVALLYDNGLAHEGAPIVRSIMQHTMAMQWLIDAGDPALEAVHEYGEDHLRNLVDSVEKAAWQLPETVSALPKPPKKNPLVNELKNFEQMCQRYEYGMHTVFRVLSAYSHPTDRSAVAYYYQQSGEPARLSGHSVVEPYRYIIQTAISLIQSGLCVDGLLDSEPLSNNLRTAAEHLGIPLELPKHRNS